MRRQPLSFQAAPRIPNLEGKNDYNLSGTKPSCHGPGGKKGPFSHLHSLLSNCIHTAQSHPLQTEISTNSALKPPYLQRIRPPLCKDNACSKNHCSMTNSSLGKHYWAQNCCLSSCHFLTVPSNSGNVERTSSSRSSNASCFKQTED